MNSRSQQTLQVCLVALSIFVPCRLSAADPITLAWDPNTDPVAGYILYVGTQSGDYSQHFDVGGVTTFTFTDAVAGQRYCFAIAAYTDTASESPPSAEVCGFSNAAPLLSNPGGLSSVLGEPTSFQLTGSDPDGQPLIYSESGLPSGLSLMTSTGFISGEATTPGDYGVTVTASDGVLSSSQSFTWTVGLSTPSPSPLPSSVSLSAVPTDRRRTDLVRLAWTVAAWDEVWVYRNGELIAPTGNTGSFTDSIWRASGDYTYIVCNPNAETCSNSVTVTF